MGKPFKVHSTKQELLNLGEWFAMPNIYVDELQRVLTPYEFSVLVLIRRETEGFGRPSSPISQNYIADKTGLSRSTIQRVLRSLVSQGHIVKTTESDHWTPDEWMLNQSCTIEVDRETVNLAEDMTERRSTHDRETVNSGPRDGQPMTERRSSIKKDSCKDNEKDTQETDKQQTDGTELVVGLLSGFGFKTADSEVIAQETLRAGLTVDDVEAWLDYVRQQGNLTNPKGFLRTRLRRGEKAPVEQDAQDPDRYMTGRYADYIKS